MSVDPVGRAKDSVQGQLLSNQEPNHLYSYMKALRNENLPFAVTTACSHYLGEYEFDVRSFPFSCMAGKTIGNILANEDIFVCPNVPRESGLIQGNVKSDSFWDVWNKKFEFFREPENRRKGKCSRCRLFDKCQGDSLHTWDFENHDAKVCVRQ